MENYEKNINIILEIPTYPYDNEFIHASWKDRLQNYIDKLYRNCLSKTLYRIVTFTDFSQIFQYSVFLQLLPCCKLFLFNFYSILFRLSKTLKYNVYNLHFFFAHFIIKLAVLYIDIICFERGKSHVYFITAQAGAL